MGLSKEVRDIKPFGRLSYHPRSADTFCAGSSEKQSLFAWMNRLTTGKTLTTALQKYYEAAFEPQRSIIPLCIDEALELFQEYRNKNVHFAVFSERQAELKAYATHPIDSIKGKPKMDEIIMLRQLSKSLGFQTPSNIGDAIIMTIEIKHPLPDQCTVHNEKEMEQYLLIDLIKYQLDAAKYKHENYKTPTLMWLQDSTRLLGNDNMASAMRGFRNTVNQNFVATGYLSMMFVSFEK